MYTQISIYTPREVFSVYFLPKWKASRINASLCLIRILKRITSAIYKSTSDILNKLFFLAYRKTNLYQRLRWGSIDGGEG